MPVQVAAEAAKEVSKAVSNDIAVLRTRFDVETGKGRKKRLTPVEAELHVNPVSIAVAAAAALLGTLAGTVAWHGVSVPNPLGPPVVIFPGLKDTQLGKDINRWYEQEKARRMGAEIVESRINLSDEEKQRVLEEQIGDAECQLLNREWQTARRSGRVADAESLLQRAKDGECPWTKGL